MRTLLPVSLLVLLLTGCLGASASSAPPSSRAQPTSSGWTAYHDRRFGYTVRYPAWWHRARRSLTPHLADPREIFSVATIPLRPGGTGCAQVPTNALRALGATDALVSIQERSGRPAGEFRVRAGHITLTEGARSEAEACAGGNPAFTAWLIPFTDGRRALYALIALGKSVSATTARQAVAVVNSLRFTSAGGAVPATVTRTLDLGAGSGAGHFVVHYPFGGATIELRAAAPAGTRFRVYVHDGVGSGSSFAGMQLLTPRDCHVGLRRIACQSGQFEAFEPGVVKPIWTVWAVKTSPRPARIIVAVAFSH